jgi:membrane protein implicated in regulation of membrane protease activity
MLVYGAIAAFGVLVLLSMLLLGELFGGDHDVSAHDVAIGVADHGAGTSIFSTRIMAAFLTAFGVGGVVARYYGLSHPAASGVGTLVGVLMSAVVYQFAKLLYSQQASSELHMTGLVGTAAQVSVAIPAGGIGQVAVSARGESSEHIARSADGQPVARGAAVVVTGIRGDAVIVMPASSRASGGSR